MSDKFMGFIDCLLNCHETHRSGTTKRERYYQYNVEPEKHSNHSTAKTGMFNTWYCEDCGDWFHKEAVRYREGGSR